MASCSSGANHDEAAAVPPTATRAPKPHDGAPASQTTARPKVYLSTPQGELAVPVEIARTDAQVERGLMFREHLPPDQGMLFLMSEERVWTFWMENTLIALDMIFIARDRTVAGIVENAAPRTRDLRATDQPSLYVLEVNGGYSAAHQITPGSKVRFENVPSR
ncbi:MAG: DUF192 domain-containing protein [Myxococcales bacterium]|nr:DUF192 domain-containing protein [Myxococcales bacterium]